MDDIVALEVVAKPAVVHPSLKMPANSSDIRSMALAAQTDSRFPLRMATSSTMRVATVAPKLMGSSSLPAVCRNPSPSSHTLPVPKSDVSRTSHPTRPGVHVSPARSQQQPSQEVGKSSCEAPVEGVNLQPSDIKQLDAVESAFLRDRPVLPENFNNLSPRAKLKNVKQFLSTFEYKQTPATHFNTHKLRPLSRIMDTARLIIYSPQPIKCVEAVFLALYLTAGIPDCDRIPLGFKTSLSGQVYQHIVLLVRHGSKFGAFGISRQADLMNKDINFNSISDVVENYKKAYEGANHVVLKIRVGLMVEHKVNSTNFVCWRHLSLNPTLQSWEECCELLEMHRLKQTRLWDLWLLTGKGGDPKRKSLARKAPLDTKLPGNEELKKKKKIKTQDTVIKSLMEAKQVGSKPHRHGGASSEAFSPEMMVKRERKHDSSLAATKSLIKVRILNTTTSNFIRQSAKYINPKLFSSRSLVGHGLLSSSQGRRLTRVSFNLGSAKQGLMGMSSKGEGGVNSRAPLSKGKHLKALVDGSTKGKIVFSPCANPSRGITAFSKGKELY